MSIIAALSIPAYFRNEATGVGCATFDDRTVVDSAPTKTPRVSPPTTGHSARGYPTAVACRPTTSSPRHRPPARSTLSCSHKSCCNSMGPVCGPAPPNGGWSTPWACSASSGVRSTGDITISLIARLVTTRNPAYSPNTTKGLLRYVQTACNYATKCGYVKVNPFSVRPLRTWVRRIRAEGCETPDAHCSSSCDSRSVRQGRRRTGRLRPMAGQPAGAA